MIHNYPMYNCFCIQTTAKFREKDGAAIVVTQLEEWYKGYAQPVTTQTFNQMFSRIRCTIRNEVWEKAGVYLNEEVIVPLCDKYASKVHQIRNVPDKTSEEYMKLLNDIQNIVSENFIPPDHKVTCDDEVMLKQLEDLSHSSTMKRYVQFCLSYST